MWDHTDVLQDVYPHRSASGPGLAPGRGGGAFGTLAPMHVGWRDRLLCGSRFPGPRLWTLLPALPPELGTVPPGHPGHAGGERVRRGLGTSSSGRSLGECAGPSIAFPAGLQSAAPASLRCDGPLPALAPVSRLGADGSVARGGGPHGRPLRLLRRLKSCLRRSGGSARPCRGGRSPGQRCRQARAQRDRQSCRFSRSII